ncbi:MAG TPA: tetratricopeptide repeat protein [Ilumatobacteraceae bacterium]|nr:tetratricopeptide repeat protein [Ilumatobacteraceae bacterium]
MAVGTDAHDNPMTGSPETIELYDRALDRLVRFHPDVIELAGELTADDSPAPMASALLAYLHLMSTDPDDLATVQAAWTTLQHTDNNTREKAHASAIGAWLNGDWEGASRLLDQLLQVWPTDLLALMIGHQLDFFLGDAQSLRDRPIRSLREFRHDHPHAAFVSGMAAFGLEESGHYSQALDAGLEAVGANPDDVWGIHAVVHTYEMQGLVDEGIRFLASDATRWKTGNMFTVHNWWHQALYSLEAGRPQEALDIYDNEIHNAASAGVPIEMLDASALLWRLMLDGMASDERFAALAEAWASKGSGQPWYSFNDLHAVMALAGADRRNDALSLIESRQHWLDNSSGAHPAGTNIRMTAEIGLPACRAVLAFVEDRHDDVIDELTPIRRTLHRFGGSHAQRDALQRTLLESALRAGRYELARALTSERLGLRESSVYSWNQRARALEGLGQSSAARAATERATAFRDRFDNTATHVSAKA